MFLALGVLFLPELKKVTVAKKLDSNRPHIAESLMYVSGWERLAWITTLPFGVIAEELVMRGYLILFIGSLTHAMILWAAISVLITVVLHLYQGRDAETILTHIVFAVIFTGLTLYTQNILASITAHLILNFFTTINIWIHSKNQLTNPDDGAQKENNIFPFIILSSINSTILLVIFCLTFSVLFRV